MRRIISLYPNKIQRLLEILVPSLTWVLITMPLWLSFWHPAMVAYLIITFDIYWFYKSFTLAVNAIKSFVTLNAHVKIDWLTLAKPLPNFSTLHHVIIIPEFHEPLHILRRTLDNFTKQDFPKERIIIVLATEDKDPDAKTTGNLLKQEYRDRFGHFLVTRHILHNGEVAGKSSNRAGAG